MVVHRVSWRAMFGRATLAVDEILEQMRWKLGTGLLVELGISVLVLAHTPSSPAG